MCWFEGADVTAGIVLHVESVWQVIRGICKELDQRTLLPAKSDVLSFQQARSESMGLS